MMKHYDLASSSLRELNQALHDPQMTASEREWRVSNSNGAHNIACGLNEQISVEIDGHAGYYCAGMNQKAHVTVNGNVGGGVAENMMSGKVHVKGDASQSAGATAHGGLLVIEGNASARCGISMKGVDIVVKGNIGPMSAFMGQAGRLVVCGDAGDALGELDHRPGDGGEVRPVCRRCAGCLEHFRVRVADERRAPRHRHIEILAAAGVPHAAAPPTLDHRRVALRDAVFAVGPAGEKPKRSVTKIIESVHHRPSRLAKFSATSSTLTPEPHDLTPSVIIVRQNGQPTATVSAPVSIASFARNTDTR